MTRSLTLSDFDFQLPPALIAQHPTPERSRSRLLDGRGEIPVDRIFHDLPDLLQAGDLLVFNDTQVVKARLYGEKPTGGKVELLVERVLQGREVVAHVKVSKKPIIGTALRMEGGFTATLLGRWPDADGSLFHYELSEDPYVLMAKHGYVPLPPYITHADSVQDEARYQTVLAKHPGAVAAPTAALHFDQALLDALSARGIEHITVTLHVGAGTYQPVKVENIAHHTMHAERYRINPVTAEKIKLAKAQGRRIIAIGTTSVRTLETWAVTGQLEGDTQIFITPGFRFKLVDVLVTNFHLPKSTLMMLVSAFAGHKQVMNLYDYAIVNHYRFFSYGDAMLLQCKPESKEI